MNQIKTFLLGEIAAPTARRLGSWLGGMLVGAGVYSGNIDQLETVITAVLLGSMDLALSYANRKGARK